MHHQYTVYSLSIQLGKHRQPHLCQRVDVSPPSLCHVVQSNKDIWITDALLCSLGGCLNLLVALGHGLIENEI